MTQFRNRNFDDRLKKGGMGDLAEGVFEQVYPKAWDRMGFNRPKTPMQGMAPFIRYTPDYMTYHGPVEVQGFGNDQTAKIKVDKLQALREWDSIQETRLFLFDSKNNRWAMLTIEQVLDLVEDDLVVIDSFPEGKQFYAIPASLVDGWTDYTPQQVDDA